MVGLDNGVDALGQEGFEVAKVALVAGGGGDGMAITCEPLVLLVLDFKVQGSAEGVTEQLGVGMVGANIDNRLPMVVVLLAVGGPGVMGGVLWWAHSRLMLWLTLSVCIWCCTPRRGGLWGF